MAVLNDDKNKKIVDVGEAPLGVNESVWAKGNETYEKPTEVTDAGVERDNAENNLKNIANQEDIVSKDTWNAINSSFEKPSAVVEADNYLASKLSTIQSGRTSYTDQVQAMMDKISNREKFSYDVDTDPLFQQALASAMNSGQQAMQDTIGQASALTGGYGSSYATSTANQAYNSYIEDAYNNLPEYYQMALEAYQMEGDEMYRQLGMYTDADDREYNRNVTAFDTTLNYRNSIYNEAYGEYRDTKSDAFASANLQINEHGQRVDDAYKLYTVASDRENTLYERSYNEWMDGINQAWNVINTQNNEAWKNKEYDRAVLESDRAYNQTEYWNKAEMDYKRDALKQDNDQFYASLNAKGSGGSGSGSVTGEAKKIEKEIPDEILKGAKTATSNEARLNYVSNMVDKGYITDEQGNYLLDTYNQDNLEDRVWKVESKGGWNWGGGVDKNAKVTDQYGTTYKMSDLWDELSKTMGKDEAEKWIIKLQKDLGISSRN